MEHGTHAELEGKPAGAYATLLKLQLQAQKADIQADLDAGLTDDVEIPASLAPMLVSLHWLPAAARALSYQWRSALCCLSSTWWAA